MAMEQLTIGKHSFGMDGYLRSNLDKLKKKIKFDWDFIIIVSGSAKTRIGKSVMAQQVAKKLDKRFRVDRIFFTAESLKKEAPKLPKHSSLVYDEARRGLSTKRALEQYSKELCEFLDDVAQLNLFIIIVLPDFFDLNKDIAIGRSIALINVYHQNNLQRGYFSFFNDDRKRKLYLIGKKALNYLSVTPNFRGRFPNYYVVNEKEYRKRKLEYFKNKGTRDYLIDRYKLKVEKAIITLRKGYGMKYREIAEIFDYNYDWIKQKVPALIEIEQERNSALGKVRGGKSLNNLNLVNKLEEKEEEGKGASI